MAKKPKFKAHIVVEGHNPGVYTNYKDVEKQTFKFSGKVHWGCTSIQEAEKQFQAICTWRCLSPENRAEKLTLEKAREIVAKMLADSEAYIQELTQGYLPTKCSEVRKAVHEAVTCRVGSAGEPSTVTLSDGTVHLVPTTPKAKSPLKNVEVASAAIHLAGERLEAGADFVDVFGADKSVVTNLTDWAPKARERGWLNASKKPFAYRDLVEPMLDIYEKQEGKLKLHSEPVAEDPVDDAPF